VTIKGTDTVHLSRDFTLAEMIRTATGLPNDPTEDRQLARMIFLAVNVLQPIRDEWGPLMVTSGFRSPEVNARVGGTASSRHLLGEAADFIPAKAAVRDVFKWIARNLALPVGQVIHECPDGKAWVHVSLPRPGSERQALVWDGKSYKAWGGV
jgi:uncharacterized protein YcbK (DUF882 family)